MNQLPTHRAVKVDLSYFIDKQFLRRPSFKGAVNDFAVSLHGFDVGRIMTTSKAGSVQVWLWTLSQPHLPDHLQPSHGECQLLLDAQAALKAKFQRWQEWTVSSGLPEAWFHLKVEP
jgi:hypothetical protein